MVVGGGVDHAGPGHTGTPASQALGAVHAYVLGPVATQQAVRRAGQRTGPTDVEFASGLECVLDALAARSGR